MTLTAQHASPAGPVLRRQHVLVPDRVYRGAYYSDDAVATYTKVRALDDRPEHCTASVENIASYLAVSKSAVERGLTQLGRPGPDGVTELTTRRQTHSGGRGQTAERRVRRPARGEPALRVPVLAAEALTGRQYRAYLLLRHAAHHHLPISAAGLAGELFHHHGAQAGLSVSERTARRLMRQLAALGWITLDERAGYQGRHLVEVHSHPIDGPREEHLSSPVGADNHDGSGPDTPGGSLVIKEDHSVTDRHSAEVSCGPAVRRQPPVARDPAVDNWPGPTTAGYGTACAPARLPAPPAPRPAPYTGPPATLSAPVWRVLAPVRDLLPSLTPWTLRRAEREILGQLDHLGDPAAAERIATRITARRAALDGGRPHDVGAWLLAVALPPGGCGLECCEDGWLYRPWAPASPPIRCEVCAELAAHRRPPPDPPPRPLRAA